MSPIPHVLLVLVIGTLAGALLAGIAGLLKATVGAHEVITTIMLNWTVVYVGLFLFGLGGPLHNDTQSSVPVSNDVVEGAKLHVFWGDPLLQGLHIGFFIALGALVVYWAILNRTTLGYGVKAVGFNPEAARYGGISVARNYFLAMAISGAFAGIAGAIDILGWQFRLSTSDITRRRYRRSRSPASPSRCSAATPRWGRSSRRCSSARSSPGRRPATSTRDLRAGSRVEPRVFDPGARHLVRRPRLRRPLAPRAHAREEGGGDVTSVALPTVATRNPLRTLAWSAIVLGLVAAFVALPPISSRSWSRACCSRFSPRSPGSSPSRGASGGSACTRSPRRCSRSASHTSRRARRSGSSTPSSSGRRSSRRCSATRRRSSSPRSAGCSPSARAW